MTRSVYQFYTRKETGEIIPSAEVTVNFAGGVEAPIFTSESGGTAIIQPLIGGASGKAVFYAEPGVYDIQTKDPVTLSAAVFYNEEISTSRAELTSAKKSDFNIDTTESLISKVFDTTPDIGTISTSKGYYEKGVGGASWIFKGVTGQTPSQSPAQLGDALLNDGDGNQWALVVDGFVHLLTLGLDVTGTIDNSLVLQAADNSAINYIGVFFPPVNCLLTLPVTKSPQTVWFGMENNASSGVNGSLITSKINGDVIKVAGDGVNRRGKIKGIRFLNESISNYPLSKAIVFDSAARDHYVEDCYIGNYDFGVYANQSKAIYIKNCFVFGAITTGIKVLDCTDCWIIETQSDGLSFGIDIEGGAGHQVINSRPQVSGVANIRFKETSFLKFRGGFSDTAINAAGGSGIGCIIDNCLSWEVSGVTMYSNGNNVPHIKVMSSSGGVCTDGVIADVIAKKSGSNTGLVFGIEFSDIAGQVKRVNISGGSLFDLDGGIEFKSVTGVLSDISITSVTMPSSNQILGADNVSSNLVIGKCLNLPTYKSYASPVSVTLDASSEEINRVSGSLAADVLFNLPSKGNYAGKQFRIKRNDGGAGDLIIKYNNGASTAATLSSAGDSVDVVSIGAGTTFVVSS